MEDELSSDGSIYWSGLFLGLLAQTSELGIVALISACFLL